MWQICSQAFGLALVRCGYFYFSVVSLGNSDLFMIILICISMIHSNYFCGSNLLQLLIFQGSMGMETRQLNLPRWVSVVKIIFLAYPCDFILVVSTFVRELCYASNYLARSSSQYSTTCTD